jgi:hypothetical protein
MAGRKGRLIAVSVALATLPHVTQSEQRNYRIAPAPDWVDEVPWSDVVEPTVAARHSDLNVVLREDQQRVSEAGSELFTHVVLQVVSRVGVESVSEIHVEFDPSYQDCSLHYVRFHRGGRIIDALKPEEVKVIQRETELERRLYDGSLTLVSFLHDVRVGDIVEYAYSTSGQNPTLGGHFSSSVELGGRRLVHRVRYRLLWPAGRVLHIKRHNTEVEPRLRALEDGGSEYVWEEEAVAPIKPEDLVPGWYDPYPWVQLSDFESWGDVVAWAIPRWAQETSLPAEIEKRVADWKNTLSSPEDRLLAALRFVQDEIRYLGMEVGPHSLTPHAPGAVCERRFGDCKDKSLLLVTLLHRLGIDAVPALVNTEMEGEIERWLPTVLAFDHVVVAADLDGRRYWLDATASFRRGRLCDLEPLAGGRALLLRPGTDALCEIPQPLPEQPQAFVKERFTVPASGQAAILEVVTEYRGSRAASIRRDLASRSLEAIQESYETFYSRAFEKVKGDKPLHVVDHPDEDLLVVEESYRLPSFRSIYREDFEAWAILDWLSEPTQRDREMPLAVPHPVYVRHRIEVRAPGLDSFESREVSLKSSGLSFVCSWGFADGAAWFDHELRSLADHVKPAEVAQHLKMLDKVKNHCGFTINEGSPAPRSEGMSEDEVLVWSIFFASLAGLLGIAAVIRLVVRRYSRAARYRRRARAPYLPGETAASAIPVAGVDQIDVHLKSLKCTCGSCNELTRREFTEVRHSDRLLHAHELVCESCGQMITRYFSPK